MKFSVLATFSGGPVDGYAPCDLTIEDVDNRLSESWAEELSVDHGENGESEYCYLADEGDDPGGFWAQCRDVTASGILDREDFFRFVDSFDLIAEDVETLGSLGGPANPCGLAPDIVMELESQLCIASVRVTPLPERGEYSEKNWERVRAAFLSIFGRHGDYDYWNGFRRG